MPVEKQVTIIYAVMNKYLLEVPVDQILDFEKELLEFVDTRYPEIYTSIREQKEVLKETEELLIKAITECKQQFLAN